MEEERIYEEVYEEIIAVGNPQPAQQGTQETPSQAMPAQPGAPAGNTRQANQQGQQSPQSQQAQSGNAEQAQQASASKQPQAAGIETDDEMVEEAEEHGQPSNTITEWQRVHDKGYVERITEKTEKH